MKHDISTFLHLANLILSIPVILIILPIFIIQFYSEIIVVIVTLSILILILLIFFIYYIIQYNRIIKGCNHIIIIGCNQKLLGEYLIESGFSKRKDRYYYEYNSSNKIEISN